MSRALALIALTLCMLAAASIVQMLVAFLLPSVAVAYVDVRVFRTWAGLGLREAAIQSVILACFFALALPTKSGLAASARTAISMLTVVGMIWICLALAVRLPNEVIGFWVVLTTIQILVGLAIHRFLFSGVEAGTNRRVIRKTALLGVISMGVLAGVVALAFQYPTPRPSYSFEIELSEGASVTIDAFIPDVGDQEPMPAVVIFHGVEGATPLTRLAAHYPNAHAISEKGFATFFVRYFEASPYDDLMLTVGEDLDVEAIENVRLKDYEHWIDIACRSIDEIRKRPDIAQDRIAVIGYSLGCYVGTAASSRLCSQGYPAAVVGNFGAIWPEVEFNSKFPPVQFYHGAEDEVIPLHTVIAAEERLLQCGVQDVEVFIYPGQKHVPVGPSSYDIRLSTERFLLEHLMSDKR